MTAQPVDRPRRVINRNKLRDTAFRKVDFKPHPAQSLILNSTARNRVAACGRRFGKSEAGGMNLFEEALRTRLLLSGLQDSGKRREFWIVGPNYTDSEKEFRRLYNALVKVDAPFDKPGTYNNAHDGDMQISLYGGKFLVIAKSAQYPERLVGEGLNGVIMAEAAKQRERTWTKYIRPMLADFNGWSLHTSTPEGKNWFYESWVRGQSEHQPEWESWRMPSWRNPYVYKRPTVEEGLRRLQVIIAEGSQTVDEALCAMLGVDLEIASLARDLTQETFNQEIGAQFNEFVGRVFKEFDEELHVRDLEFDPSLKTFAAVDYGFTNPFVWLLCQEDAWGNIYVIDELYQRGLTIDEACDELAGRGLVPSSLREFYPDPASPGDTKAIEKRFRIRGKRGTGGSLDTRLRMIRNALQEKNKHLPEGHIDRQPKLLFNRKCVETIRDFGAYRYPKTVAEAIEAGKNVPEAPLKKDDHAPEALGRFYASRFSLPERSGGSRVREANIG